jgi:outer membrane cobalamin receptor
VELPLPLKRSCYWYSEKLPMSLKTVLFLFLAVSSSAALGQQAPTSTPAPVSNPSVPPLTESIVVTGTFLPVPLSENDRSVESLDTQQYPLLYSAGVDYLRLDPTINLQQRAPYGVQSDLSILGSTFGETLVLLNGLRLNDAQSSHHNMDIAVPMEAMSRIEVLHGAGSTFYGADAMGGAVNFITAPSKATEIRVLAGAGNQGFNQQHVLGSFLFNKWSETIAADRDFSSGFRPDRDFRSAAASSETRFKSALGVTDVLFAGSDRPYGADQFYGNFPSWERTKNWFASAQQDMGERTSAAFGYRRHTDEFILFRNDPAIYENNHIDQSWQAALRRRQPLHENTTLSYGAEGQWDAIVSNNLGNHARNREALYGNLDFRALQRFSLSVGAREELFSGGKSFFTPALAGGVWLKPSLKLRASVSRGFRLPTYTDLYYCDPANFGNPLLKPESAWSFDAGADWNSRGLVSAGTTIFQRWDSNLIDYVKRPGQSPCGSSSGVTQVNHAENVDRLHFTGVASNVNFRLPHQQRIEISYVFLYGNRAPAPGTVSLYAFNYPSHEAVFGWVGAWRQLLVARTRVGITQRYGQDAYPVWDLSIARKEGAVRPYLQLTNLSNTGFAEVPGVLMPSRSVVGGAEIVLARAAR